MLQPVGGMDRIAHAIYEQVKPVVRLRTPVTAIRRTGARVRIELGQRARRRRRLLRLHAAGEPAGADPERFLAGQESGAAGHPVSAERQGRVRKPALLGKRRAPLRRARLDRPAERERDLPVERVQFAKGVLVAAYVAGWTQPGQPAALRGAEPRGTPAHQPRFDRGAASRQVAPAEQGRDRRLGADAVVRGRRRDRPGLRCRRPQCALCRAIEARRPDRLRRRAFELRRAVAGRRGAVGARGAEDRPVDGGGETPRKARVA